jgi:hypothetical protein
MIVRAYEWTGSAVTVASKMRMMRTVAMAFLSKGKRNGEIWDGSPISIQIGMIRSNPLPGGRIAGYRINGST